MNKTAYEQQIHSVDVVNGSMLLSLLFPPRSDALSMRIARWPYGSSRKWAAWGP